MSLSVSQEVADALADHRPVVALESTIISHGLPRPRNNAVAVEFENILRDKGVVPATIAVLDGVAHIGLDASQVQRIAEDTTLRKLGFRDLAAAVASGASGATTVAGTAHLAARAGLRVFATGGLGGVHREWTTGQDESADLNLLSRTRITVVCAGVKSILDIKATLQRLETLNVLVAGFGTQEFPAFYQSTSGEPVDWTINTASEAAAVMRGQDLVDGLRAAFIVANPVPSDQQLDPDLHDRVLNDALAAADKENITGQAVTPYLLSYLADNTHGASLEANLAAVRGNVALAADISIAWTQGA